MEELLRCSVCGEPLGVYEPLVAVADGRGRITSLAREPDAGSSAETLVHRSCSLHAPAEGNGDHSAGAAADRGH